MSGGGGSVKLLTGPLRGILDRADSRVVLDETVFGSARVLSGPVAPEGLVPWLPLF